jgi:hypothetical protein
LSHLNTPAKPSSKGTTALLKMLFENGSKSLPITGLPLYRHTTSSDPATLSSQGMFASEEPIILHFSVIKHL